jgi:drug/metabolite transporter (DMT)-like permease
MSDSNGSSPPATLALVLAFATIYVIWGSTYLAIRFAVETLPPFSMASVRFLVAGGVLYAWSRSRGIPTPTGPEWRASAIVGALLLVGGNGGVVWAEQYIASGTAALMVATVPIWMVVLEWLSGQGPRPHARVVVGLAVGLLGVWLLVSDVSARQPDLASTIGIAALLFAAFSWAAGSIYSRRGGLPASPWMATATQMLMGGTLLGLIAAASGEVAAWDLSAASARSIAALVYLIVAGAIVAYSAYVWLLRVSTPAAVSTYAYVNPVVAVALGWLFAGEPLTPRTAVASAIILSAVVLVHRSQAGRRNEPTGSGVTHALPRSNSRTQRPSR